jgi:hypothetical protein
MSAFWCDSESTSGRQRIHGCYQNYGCGFHRKRPHALGHQDWGNNDAKRALCIAFSASYHNRRVCSFSSPYVREVLYVIFPSIVPVPWESLAQAGFSQNIIVFSHGLDEGKICIGATEAHCDVTNDIEYHRKIDESGFWKIGGATICVTAISSKVCFESKTIIFDTASDFILGPEKEVDSIYTETFGTANGRSLPESNRGHYGFNWDTTQVTLASIPEISIQVEGKKEWLIKSDQ